MLGRIAAGKVRHAGGEFPGLQISFFIDPLPLYEKQSGVVFVNDFAINILQIQFPGVIVPGPGDLLEPLLLPQSVFLPYVPGGDGKVVFSGGLFFHFPLFGISIEDDFLCVRPDFRIFFKWGCGNDNGVVILGGRHFALTILYP